MNDAILLTEGSKALVSSIVTGQPLSFSKFRIGSTTNFTPSINATDVANYVYEGSRSSIRWYLADNPEILVIELILKASVGNFNVGNIMIFDNNNRPFCFSVRNSPIPKIRTTSTQVGSELIITVAVRIMSNEKSSAVTVYLEDRAVVPVVSTGDDILATEPEDATFPFYIAENFKGTNIPAVLYADAEQNEWWVNRFFKPYRSGGFNIVSGGYAGDTYSRPFGELRSGGEFTQVNADQIIADGGAFDNDIEYTILDAGNFGE